REDIPQCLFVSFVPEAKDLSGQLDMGIVAFRVHLLAQKMNKPVPAGECLVHGRGNLPQFTFCADFIEIDRENTSHLLDHFIDRGDVRVEEFRDVPLEKVGVGNEYPADSQVYNKRGQKL